MDQLPIVLFLHPSDELYGADRSLRSLILAARDIVQPIVILPNDIRYRGELSASLREAGVEVLMGPLPVVRRRYLHPARLAPWAVKSIAGSVWLTVLARRRRAAAIVSNTTAVVGGPITARLVGVPHVWYVREVVERPRWYRAMVRTMARMSRGKVIAVSGAVAEWLGTVSGRGPLVLYNGVDIVGDPAPLPAQPQAVFVGRFNGWKGQETFIKAAALAHADVPTATFALVGGAVPDDTIAARTVTDLTRSADPGGTWLRIVGEVPDPRAVMRQSWVVAVPSTRPDPLPNVVLEAMAEGRAVVGSDLGGIPEMVSDGHTGCLVAPGDSRQLADRLRWILSDRELATSMGGAGRSRIDRAFSRQRMESSWRALLRSVLEAAENAR